MFCFFFFKQKTAYELRISDWSSDVCSSDLTVARVAMAERGAAQGIVEGADRCTVLGNCRVVVTDRRGLHAVGGVLGANRGAARAAGGVVAPDRDTVTAAGDVRGADGARSEEHTSEPQSLMRISYAVF